MRSKQACANITLLPPLGVVFAEALAEILVPAPVVVLIFRAEVYLLGVLLQVRDVMCSVSSLEDSRSSLVLLLALPEEVAAKTCS